MKKGKHETKKSKQIVFHYDPDSDIMHVTRMPHRFSSYCLELENNIQIMVDKDIKEVLGLVFLNYYEYIPQFYKNKSFKGIKCRDCKSQKECFAWNIEKLLESEIQLKEIKQRKAKAPNVESDLPERMKRLPEKAFACT